MSGGRQGVLFGDVDDGDGSTVAVSGRCHVRIQDGYCVVYVGGVAAWHFAVDDRVAAAHAMASIVEAGWAEQREVAVAFGCAARTVRRYQRRLEEGGLAALGRPRGYPSGQPRGSQRSRTIVAELKAQGVSNREIARRRGVSEKAIRNQLRRLGWKPAARPVQAELPLGAGPSVSAPSPSPVAEPPARPAPGADPKLSAPSTAPVADSAVAPTGSADPKLSAPVEDPLPETLDTDPADRSVDRFLAHMGLLSDAAPLFGDGDRVPRAGALLAMPALVDSGIFEIARAVYESIGPAFYGLRTSVVTLLLMALLRIKRPEAVKEHSPSDLGRILGLDRAPEVKTLRRKLARLAAVGRATELGRRLAQRRVAQRPSTLGFLYVDGHVRVYHGERDIPKTHVARMRLAAPATSDYWVNDAKGDPLFVVTAKANAGMVKMLPPLLDEMRALAGTRRVTVVFDRGGWSPRLFQKILDGGFDLITYRKGKTRAIPLRHFIERTKTLDGRKLRYTLAEREVDFLGGALKLRQVTRLSDDKKHQTHILTSRRDLSIVEVAFRMFERWRQENFFKYLREEYALDALVDYAVEPDDATREVPNPKYADANNELRTARRRLALLEQEVGMKATMAALGLDGKRSRSPIDRTIAAALAEALAEIVTLERRRATIPRRIPVAQRTHGIVIKLSTERKHLSNILKMVAYQAESDLVRLIAPHYARSDDDGRTLIQTALATAADLRVTDDELRITLAPQSSPHRTAAVAALCCELDRRRVCFPGTRLVLRYAVAG